VKTHWTFLKPGASVHYTISPNGRGHGRFPQTTPASEEGIEWHTPPGSPTNTGSPLSAPIMDDGQARREYNYTSIKSTDQPQPES
jgi:hypothetical protein